MLTHGVGPMRTYGVGAMLLDLQDPSKVLGSLPEPLLAPSAEERDGYVPNVLYSMWFARAPWCPLLTFWRFGPVHRMCHGRPSRTRERAQVLDSSRRTSRQVNLPISLTECDRLGRGIYGVDQFVEMNRENSGLWIA